MERGEEGWLGALESEIPPINLHEMEYVWIGTHTQDEPPVHLENYQLNRYFMWNADMAYRTLMRPRSIMLSSFVLDVLLLLLGMSWPHLEPFTSHPPSCTKVFSHLMNIIVVICVSPS